MERRLDSNGLSGKRTCDTDVDEIALFKAFPGRFVSAFSFCLFVCALYLLSPLKNKVERLLVRPRFGCHGLTLIKMEDWSIMISLASFLQGECWGAFYCWNFRAFEQKNQNRVLIAHK